MHNVCASLILSLQEYQSVLLNHFSPIELRLHQVSFLLTLLFTRLINLHLWNELFLKTIKEFMHIKAFRYINI